MSSTRPLSPRGNPPVHSSEVVVHDGHSGLFAADRRHEALAVEFETLRKNPDVGPKELKLFAEKIAEKTFPQLQKDFIYLINAKAGALLKKPNVTVEELSEFCEILGAPIFSESRILLTAKIDSLLSLETEALMESSKVTVETLQSFRQRLMNLGAAYTNSYNRITNLIEKLLIAEFKTLRSNLDVTVKELKLFAEKIGRNSFPQLQKDFTDLINAKAGALLNKPNVTVEELSEFHKMFKSRISGDLGDGMNRKINDLFLEETKRLIADPEVTIAALNSLKNRVMDLSLFYNGCYDLIDAKIEELKKAGHTA